MSTDAADPSPPIQLDDHRAPDSTSTPLISPEPLVEPPSPAEVPMAMVKERGWIVGVLALVLVGLFVALRRIRSGD